MEWIPNPRQENLLWHFLRTGDYFCCPAKHLEIALCGAVLFVAGTMEDRPKLEAIRDILDGGIARCRMEYVRGTPRREYELAWWANEHTEKYLRWFLDKLDNHGIIDAHSKRRYIVEALEACDAYNQHRKA